MAKFESICAVIVSLLLGVMVGLIIRPTEPQDCFPRAFSHDTVAWMDFRREVVKFAGEWTEAEWGVWVDTRTDEELGWSSREDDGVVWSDKKCLEGQ